MSSITTATIEAQRIPTADPRSIVHLGMDVHKDSITIAVLHAGAKTPERLDRIPSDPAKRRRFVDRVADRGEVQSCYEASSAGYVIHRAMREWGYPCDVIAPSLIPKRPGVQRKHDKRDPSELAKLHRAGDPSLPCPGVVCDLT